MNRLTELKKELAKCCNKPGCGFCDEYKARIDELERILENRAIEMLVLEMSLSRKC